MLFNAAGTTQAKNGSMYGGIVYAYSENEVMIWRPVNGPVIYIGDRWGNGESKQTSYTADVIIRVYHLPLAGTLIRKQSKININQLLLKSSCRRYVSFEI